MSATAPDIADDPPMTLAEACDRFFRGTITPASLRAEAARGNLDIIQIGRKHYVTSAALTEMLRKCRVSQKAPASGSMNPSASGMSETEQRSAGLAAALQSANALKQRFKRTSPKNTSRSAPVIPLRSPSKMS